MFEAPGRFLSLEPRPVVHTNESWDSFGVRIFSAPEDFLGKRTCEIAADRVEGSIDFAGQMAHARDCAKRDERHNERVLNQVLTFFSVDNGLGTDKELQDKSIEHGNEFPWMLESYQGQICF